MSAVSLGGSEPDLNEAGPGRAVLARRPGATRRARVLLGVLAVLVLAGAWLAVRAEQARAGLLAARSSLTGVAGLSADSADPAQLDGLRRRASTQVHRARSAVDDPLWRLAAHAPLAGRPFAAVRQATLVAQDVVDGVLPPALLALRDVRAADLLAGGRIDLDLLARLSPELDRAAAAADRARARQLPNGLPGPLAGPVATLRGEVDRLAEALSTARTAVSLAPSMLGRSGPRRYFLAVQNNAEARGTGGLVGAYAVVRADGGRLSLDAVGTNTDFVTATAPAVDLGPEFAGRYDPLAGRTLWSSAGLTPDWPSAAQVMAGLWRAQGGGPLDGVLGVDPVAMAELLRVTGPATASGRQVGADNVVDFILRDEYAEFADGSAERKQALAGLARSLYEKVAAGGYSAPAMLAALARTGNDGHLQMWSARPAEQALIARMRVSGSLDSMPGAALQVVSVNASGNKIDYYLRRSVDYRRTGPGSARVTVTLTNLVDAKAVPPVVVQRLDPPEPPVEAGASRVQLSIYTGRGDVVRRVLVDGAEVAADLGTERGHGVGTVRVEVRPSRPVVVTADVSDQGGPLSYRQQPLVVDDDLHLPAGSRPG